MLQNKEKQDSDVEKGLLGDDSKSDSPSISNRKNVFQLKTFRKGTKTEATEQDISVFYELFDQDTASDEEENKQFEEADTMRNVKNYKSKIRTFFKVIQALKSGDKTEPNAHQSMEYEVDQLKWTALHHASAKGDITVLRALLDAGDDPNVTDDKGRTAVDVAGIAFYQGTHIHSLATILQILLETNGKFNTMEENDTRSRLDTPIHTAVELNCQKSIRILLDAGASVGCRNSNGLTPLHICIENKHEECLKILLKYNINNTETVSKRANMENLEGFTLLQAAVVKEWLQGVKILIECGADVTATPNVPFDKYNDVLKRRIDNRVTVDRLIQHRESPIHLAADVGNEIILRELLNENRRPINTENYIGYTPLFLAIQQGNLDCIKTLLEMGANALEVSRKNETALHVAIKFKQEKVIVFLLHNDDDISNKMVNSFDESGCAPIHIAALCNNVDVMRLLVRKKASLRLQGRGPPYPGWTPLHIAAAKNFSEMVKVILQCDTKAKEVTNSDGLMAIHIAISHCHRETITVLLRNGAVLSSQTEPESCRNNSNNKKTSVLKMISSELPNPTTFFEEIFDSFIKSHEFDTKGSRIIHMNYQVFTKPDSFSQIKVVEDLITCGHEKLLIHPLVESLIYLKWRTLLPIFCVIMIVHVIFALSLYGSIIADFHDDRSEIGDAVTQRNPYRGLFFTVPLGLVILLEFMYVNIQRRRYFHQAENWTKLASIFAASLLLCSSSITWIEMEWTRHVATVALLLAWAQIMFLFSRFPQMGFYVYMFGNVSLHIFKILFMFGFFVLAFALCFMIQYHSKPPFGGPWEALMKTIVMMTSEFEYEKLFGEDHTKELSNSKPFVHVMFVIFLIFVSIVFVNFMVGVSVSDVNDMIVKGNITRLEKQVEFLSTLEVLAFGLGIKKYVSTNFSSKKFVDCMKISVDITKKWLVRYKKTTEFGLSFIEKNMSMPSHITENILNKINVRKERNNEERSLKQLKDEVHFIYDFITDFSSRFLTEEVLQRLESVNNASHHQKLPAFRKSVQDAEDVTDNINIRKKCPKDQNTQTDLSQKRLHRPRCLGTRLYFTKRFVLKRRSNYRNCLLQKIKANIIQETKAKQTQLKRFRKLEKMLKQLS